MASAFGRELHKEVELSIEGGHMTVDKQVLEGIKGAISGISFETLFIMGLNRRANGFKPENHKRGPFGFMPFKWERYLLLELWDDGRGLDIEAIKQTAAQDQLFTREELEAMPLPQIESLSF